MRNERWLVGLVLADFFLAILTIALEFALNWTLPPPLRGYVFSQMSTAGASAARCSPDSGCS